MRANEEAAGVCGMACEEDEEGGDKDEHRHEANHHLGGKRARAVGVLLRLGAACLRTLVFCIISPAIHDAR